MKKSRMVFIIVVLIIVLFTLKIIYNVNLKKYEVEEVMEEKYMTFEENNKVGVKDNKDNIIIEAEYYKIQIPNPSKAIFVCFYDFNSDTKFYRTKVINSNNTELFAKYGNLEAVELNGVNTNIPYEKNILRFSKNGKYGLIDLNGNMVVKAIYDSISGLANKEGELLVQKEGKYGVINTKGAELIKEEYDYIWGDEYYTQEDKYALSGYILGIKTNNGYRYGYMNYKQKIILNVEFNDIIRLGEINTEDTAKDIFIVANKDGQYGLIKNKKVLMDFKYQSIDYSGIKNFFIVERNSKYGVFNSRGEKIINVKYNEVKLYDNYIYTKLNTEEAYYNLLGNRVDKSTIKIEGE